MEREEATWLAFAKTDLGVAQYLDESYYPKPLEIICYHCQQAAEKSIKALIFFYGAQGGMPRKHNLSFLLMQIKNMVYVPDKYYDYADSLTPYGIAVRYPNELYLEDRHAKDALKYASEIVAWVEGIIPVCQDRYR